ncbi:MAG: paraslipin [Verrucomicrobiales bacterium]|nr:paraslipin [Verrucomicrobiales bacterium]|tara:strand:- start:3178 stop:4056 length:879 start_codon:yes stop_codon:yes gene_type:complete
MTHEIVIPWEQIAYVLAVMVPIIIILRGIKVVPQSENFVVERFGKYTRTLKAGLNFIIPMLDSVARELSILERQLPEKPHDVITKDNVTIVITNTIFFKIVDAAKATYRIQDLEGAINNAVTGTVRSIIGAIEFDEVQSHRDEINRKIKDSLEATCSDWGVDITRTEILDVDVDENTKKAMQQQINAERERRAVVMAAEGEKKSAELSADAELYTAQKQADAKRLLAEADAYATKIISEAINNNGEAAVRFEIQKRQVQAVGELSSSSNSKIIVLPNDIVSALGSFSDFFKK